MTETPAETLAQPVEKIIVPHGFYSSEILAVYLLKHSDQGEKLFPGIKKAAVHFKDANTVFKKTPEQLLRESKTLLIKMGGGMFDPQGKPQVSSATLVADKLGVRRHPALQQLLLYSINERRQTAAPCELASAIKRYHQQKVNPFKVWTKFTEEIEMWYHEQEQMVKDRSAAAQAAMHRVSHHGKEIRIAAIQSDSPNIGKVLRSREIREGASADVVIVRNSRGQVKIEAPKDVSLVEVAAAIRATELRMRKLYQMLDVLNADELRQDGNVVHPWFFLKEHNLLLNGSLSAPNTEASKIPFDALVNIVKSMLTTEKFHRDYDEQFCSKGKCSKQCPWHCYELTRCSEKTVVEIRTAPEPATAKKPETAKKVPGTQDGGIKNGKGAAKKVAIPERPVYSAKPD